MITEELVELTKWILEKKTERQDLEIKTAHGGCPKRLYDTLSSFSNQDGGGILFFGIDEKEGFKLSGVYDLQDLQKKVVEQCNQMVPPVRAVFTVAEVNGFDVCSAEIPGLELSERPCYYKGAGRLKGAYTRVGDADMVMTEYELYSYEAFRKHLHDDERPVERAIIEDLDARMLNSYMQEKKAERPGFAQLTDARAYELMDILRDGKPTLAAVMNMGIYPQGFMPQLCITAVVVPGENIGDTDDHDIRFSDNKRIEGTLAEQVREAIAFCKRNMKTKTVIDKQTGERRDIDEYPVAAIREAILNAVIHRDYSIYTEGTPIQVVMYRNRLEVHSPGNLYGRMTVDQLGVAKPDLRNPALATMIEALTRAENRYSGIPTMRREMKLSGLPEPVFENRRNEFVVTFYNTQEQQENTAENTPESVKASLLDFCRTPRTRAELKDYMNISTFTYIYNRYIVPLVEAGQLELTLPDKPRSRNQRYRTIQ